MTVITFIIPEGIKHLFTPTSYGRLVTSLIGGGVRAPCLVRSLVKLLSVQWSRHTSSPLSLTDWRYLCRDESRKYAQQTPLPVQRLTDWLQWHIYFIKDAKMHTASGARTKSSRRSSSYFAIKTSDWNGFLLPVESG